MLDLKSIKAVFKASPAPCIVLLADAPRYTIVGVNDASLIASNASEKDLINKGLFEAFPDNPNDLNATGIQTLTASLERVIATKASHKMAVQRHDIPVRGTNEFEVRYWKAENSPVLNEQGAVEFIIHTATDVTGQVLSEEKEKENKVALLKNEEQYRLLFDHHPDAVYSFDLEGNFLSANPGAAKLAECSIEELLKTTFLRLIPSEDLARVLDHFIKACTGEIQNYNTGLITSKGKRLEINVTNLPIIMNKEIIGVYGIAKDITHAVKAEQKLQQNRERLQKIMDYSLDVICTSDAHGNFVNVSRAAEAVWGYTPEELEGKPYMDLVYQEDKEVTNQTAGDIINGAEVTRFVNHYKRKDGRIVAMSWSAYWDADEELMYCVARDITEYREAAETLKNSETRFRALIQNSTEGIALVSEDGIVLERSYSALQILGLKSQEKGKKWSEVLHLDDLALGLKTLSEVRSVWGECKTIECRLALSDKWVEFTFHNLLNEPAIKAIVINSRDITEKKKASQTLRSSELRYRNLFQSNPLPMWIYDSTTFCFLEVNLAAVEKYGYSEKEFLRMKIQDIRPPQDIELLKKVKGTRTTYGIRYEGHWRHLKKDGDLLFVDITSQSIDREGGKATLVLANDITKRVKAERDTRTSEEVRRLIMDSAQDSIICTDQNGCVTLWNIQAEKLFGWSREEMMGKDISQYIIPEQHRLRYKSSLKNYLKTGKGFLINPVIEVHAVNKHQNEFPIELTMISIEQEEGGFFCAFIRDITERKHHVTALELSEQRFKSLVQEGSDLISILDENRQYTYLSPAYTSLLGIPSEELIGNKALNRIHKDDRERVSKTSELLKTEKRIQYLPFRYRAGNGQYRWLESIATNLTDDPSVKGILFNSKDITDRVNHIRAIEEQNIKLREIAWMQSHVVRAPLSRIMGLANVIANYSDEDIDIKDLLRSITTSAHELDEIVRDIVQNTQQIDGPAEQRPQRTED